MAAVILLGAGFSLLGWLMLQAPTRPSTPELYDEYKHKSKQ